jgi:undecaprenyl-diphosphatase
MLNWWLITILALGVLVGFWRLDHFFLEKIRRAHKILPPGVEKFFRFFSFTPFVFVALFAAPFLVLIFQKDFYSAEVFFIGCLLATGLAFVGKYLFKRVRPFGHETYLGKIDSAFPSAHTAGSFAAAFSFALFWPAFAVPVFVFAGVVAFSRMYLELHFFSDVAGGILVAHLMTALVVDSDLLTIFGF